MLTDAYHVCDRCASGYYVTADETYAEAEDPTTHEVHPLESRPGDPYHLLCPACGGRLVNVDWVDKALSLHAD